MGVDFEGEGAQGQAVGEEVLVGVVQHVLEEVAGAVGLELDEYGEVEHELSVVF